MNIDRLRTFTDSLRTEVGQLRHRGLSEMADVLESVANDHEHVLDSRSGHQDLVHPIHHRFSAVERRNVGQLRASASDSASGKNKIKTVVGNTATQPRARIAGYRPTG